LAEAVLVQASRHITASRYIPLTDMFMFTYLILSFLPVVHSTQAVYQAQQLLVQNATPSRPPTYAFFSHHKSGTVLNSEIANDMAAALGMKVTYVPWSKVDSASCVPGTVMFLEDIRVNTLIHMMAECPNLRAVHLVRDIPHSVASNYAYTIDLKPGEEIPFDVQRGAKLRAIPLSAGVAAECREFVRDYGKQMVNVHNYVLQNKLDNVKEVHFENFHTDYSATTRAMFEHFLGKDDPQIDALVGRSLEHDVDMWNSQQLALHHRDANHMSDDGLKARARTVLQNMYLQQRPCAVDLMKLNYALGYGASP